MQFEYAQYFNGCLLFPIFISIATLFLFLPSMVHDIAKIVTHRMKARDYSGLLVTILICGFFLCLNIGRLSHGGIWLIFEKESDAVKENGKIVEIVELGRFEFPELNAEHDPRVSNGVRIILDSGITCTAITYGPFVIGDDVTIIYLPKSKYVLSIYSRTGDGVVAQTYCST